MIEFYIELRSYISRVYNIENGMRDNFLIIIILRC